MSENNQNALKAKIGFVSLCNIALGIIVFVSIECLAENLLGIPGYLFVSLFGFLVLKYNQYSTNAQRISDGRYSKEEYEKSFFFHKLCLNLIILIYYFTVVKDSFVE